MRTTIIVLIAVLISGLQPVSSTLASRPFARISDSIQAASPTVIPPAPTPAEVAASGPPLSLTLMLLFTCCALGLVLGILIIGFMAGITNRKAEKEGSKK